MKKKIAAIGFGDEMLAFSCVGAESFAASDAADAKRIILGLTDAAVVFLSERLFSVLGNFTERFRDAEFPVLLPIAGLSGSDGAARRALERAAELVGIGAGF